MKKKLVAGLAAGMLLLVMNGAASAGIIAPVSVTPGGEAIIDGYTPPEWTGWTSSTTYWYGVSPQYVIDYGTQFKIKDVVISVDNNDSYRVDYSTNGSSWSSLFAIAASDGNVSWGMDTMSSISTSPDYVAGMNFAEVNARYLKVYATGGDGMYSVGELQSHGTPTPEPATMLLLGSGLAGLAAARRKKTARN